MTNGGSLNNWLFNTDAMGNWLFSPASNPPGYVLSWINFGYVVSGSVDYDFAGAVRPVLNLKSETTISDGDGSFGNPYILNVE